MNFLEFVLSALTFMVPGGDGRPTDRELLAVNSVNSGLRSARGRVLGIGTEWSEGISVIGPDRLHFTPSIGIVGDRDIEVSAVRKAQGEAGTRWCLRGALSTTFILTTHHSELYWTIHRRVASPALVLLGVSTEQSLP